MNIVSIELNDGQDMSTIVDGAEVSISIGDVILAGRVLARTSLYMETVTQVLVPHTHEVTVPGVVTPPSPITVPTGTALKLNT
ncbi:MAG: hypothetical protein WC359_12845 [Dehalococcoidia bacterium]|jgi:hypothetical protein